MGVHPGVLFDINRENLDKVVYKSYAKEIINRYSK